MDFSFEDDECAKENEETQKKRICAQNKCQNSILNEFDPLSHKEQSKIETSFNTMFNKENLNNSFHEHHNVENDFKSINNSNTSLDIENNLASFIQNNSINNSCNMTIIKINPAEEDIENGNIKNLKPEINNVESIKSEKSQLTLEGNKNEEIDSFKSNLNKNDFLGSNEKENEVTDSNPLLSSKNDQDYGILENVANLTVNPNKKISNNNESSNDSLNINVLNDKIVSVDCLGTAHISNFNNSDSLKRKSSSFLTDTKKFKISSDCAESNIESVVQEIKNSNETIDHAQHEPNPLLNMNSEKTDLEQNINNLNQNTQNTELIAKLTDENSRMRTLIDFYDTNIFSCATQIDRIIADYELKFRDLRRENESFREEIGNVDKAYQHTFNRYCQLKDSFSALKENEVLMIKTNTDLRKALELTSQRINELLREIDDVKVKNEAQINKLNTALKVDAVKISSLEKTIVDLTHQKDELTSICEEFLSSHGK